MAVVMLKTDASHARINFNVDHDPYTRCHGSLGKGFTIAAGVHTLGDPMFCQYGSAFGGRIA